MAKGKNRAIRRGAAINLNGAALSADAKRVAGMLDKHLARAIELGRTEVGVEIVQRLSSCLGVNGTMITNCTFTGS